MTLGLEGAIPNDLYKAIDRQVVSSNRVYSWNRFPNLRSMLPLV